MATEKRLIDANALKAIFDKRYDTAFMQERTRTNAAWWDGYATGVNWGRNTITDVPTVDAVEVVHGQWIPVPSSDMMTGKAYKCSELGKMRYGSYMPNYCQCCGADMRGDGNV